MDARLTILNGPSSGQMIPVLTGKLIIGREEDCHLRPPSEFVSRHHCVLLLDEYTLRVRDLGSKNGTFVNSRRLGAGETILLDGDIIAVGKMVCQINIAANALVAIEPIPNAPPATSPPALEGTRVIDGDTVQAEGPEIVSSSSAPAETPIVP